MSSTVKGLVCVLFGCAVIMYLMHQDRKKEATDQQAIRDKYEGKYVIINLSGQRGQITEVWGVWDKDFYIRYETTVVREKTEGIISQSQSAYSGKSYTVEPFKRFEFRLEGDLKEGHP